MADEEWFENLKKILPDKNLNPTMHDMANLVTYLSMDLNKAIVLAKTVNKKLAYLIMNGFISACLVANSDNIDEALNNLEKVRDHIIKVDKQVAKVM